jgi:hypothetical protein
MSQIQVRDNLTASDSMTPAEYVIAFLDVLGFRARVRTTSLPVLITEYERLLGDIAWSKRVPIVRLQAGVVDQWVTRVVVASDSILLWSDVRPEAIDMLLTSASRVLGRAAEMGWPLRGTITAGACVMHEQNGVFIGEALVRAVELEKGQNWLGCAVDDRALDHAAAGRTVRTHVDVVWHDVPTKRGCPRLRAALWWKDSAPEARGRLLELRNMVPRRQRQKYDAALAFVGGEPRRVALAAAPPSQFDLFSRIRGRLRRLVARR